MPCKIIASSSGSKSGSKSRCLLCNCLSHTTANCNSNMKGRRGILDAMKNYLMDDEMPDFNSFPVNELRYIVNNQLNKIRGKISLTLPKTRIIHELVSRWSLYAPVRSLKQMRPKAEDCPICMEQMWVSIWNSRRLRWDSPEAILSNPDALFPSNIKTECGHTFCGSCWERHYGANRKYSHQTGEQYLCCPLCRHELKCPW